jgi:iron complex transport system substrate-binding protein
MKQIAEVASRQAVRPRVALIEWIDPLMAAGNWHPDLIAMAGGVDLFGAPGRHAPWIAWEALRDADPDVVVIAPCGFDLARTARELGPLVARPGWEGLRAVREGRVVLADGNAFFNRPGPRVVETLEILAEVLHPGAFAFGHEGSGWVGLAAAGALGSRGERGPAGAGAPSGR